MDFLTEYGLFLAEAVTIVLAILVVVGGIAAIASKDKESGQTSIEVKKLNDKLRKMKEQLQEAILSKDALKALAKEEKKKAKEKEKAGNTEENRKKRVFVLDFDGDIKASQVSQLREGISAVLCVATPEDEVVVRLESGGGMVHSYGLASAQLDRVRQKGIPLTVCVDKVAASGGYMMACVADKIIASPFAILGSIGVVAQIPNVHKLLKKHDIDVEVLTAGEYKRTLTVFGENTEKGRKKFIEDLEDTHDLFKQFVKEHRPVVDIDQVANGDIWFGRRALSVNLADELKTSDEYLIECCDAREVFEVKCHERKSLSEKLGLAASHGVENAVTRLVSLLKKQRFMS